ncbi:MAG: metalloregulator ArsR/SmtB family transcription factor [Lyngbya sp. HA4199-MV5]|jgi:ATP-dependent Clp protease ATP-binding subunit ClpC|nr:metalloregulator ArsR/SmtB family transcription factor [Lyngbya sp. HA4199-MV5]
MTNEDAARYADSFAALGSEPRLEIMRLLLAAHPHGLTVSDLQAQVKIPNSTMSHHLEKLRVEGLVSARREKQFLWYSANPQKVEALLFFLYNGCAPTGFGNSASESTKTANATIPAHSHEDKFMFEAFLRSVNHLFSSVFDRLGLPGFERFTDPAIQSIVLAQQESRDLNHAYVGTEQLLLGLMQERTDVAAQVLAATGLTAETVRAEVETIIGRGRGTPLTIPLTPRAKRVIELSLEQARQLGHRYIGTEHLLLGILCEGEGLAARVLQNLGLNLQTLEEQVRQEATRP